MDKKKTHRLMGYACLAGMVVAGGLMVYRGQTREAGLPNPISRSESLPDVDDAPAQPAVGQATQTGASAPAAEASLASIGQLPSAAGPAPSAAASESPTANAAGPTVATAAAPSGANDKRLARLERNVHELIAGLRAQGYMKPATAQPISMNSAVGIQGDEPLEPDVAATDFNPYPVPLAAKNLPGAATVPVAAARRQVKVAAKPAAAASQPQAPQGELLSVDMWDGRPSAVVGTDIPGDTRIRIMAVGDIDNGVALKAVDVSSQRATFNVAGRDVQLSVDPASTVR